jgi:hypothetical protein
MKTTVRLHPDYETDNAWGGQTKEVSLMDKRGAEYVAITLENIANLWYFQFKEDENPTIYQYFGVIDFDFKRILAKPGITPKKETLLEDEDIKKIIQLLDQKYENFTVYFSGRKGIHVYIYMKDFFTFPPPALSKDRERIDWLHSYLCKEYGQDIFDLLDVSIYHINKGIRPYSMPHPKTGIRPFVLFQKGPHECIWTYLITTKPWEGAVSHDPEITTFMRKKVRDSIYKSGTSEVLQNNTIPGASTDMERMVIEYLETFPGKSKTGQIRLEKSSSKCPNLFTVKNTNYCPIKKGCHSRCGKSYVYLYSHHATFRCFSDTCGTESEFTLKRYMVPLTNLSDLADDLFSRGEISQKYFESISIPAEQKYVGLPDIEWALGNDDVGKYGYIAAPMSCGKTTSLRTYIESQSPDFSCLLIVVRQSQAHTFAPIYPGMVNYLECKQGSLYGENKLVVCINSLTRIFAPGGFLRQYDLLILDEFESILETSTNASMSNGKSFQTEIWETLIALIKCCKRTIFMDGIPTEVSLKYLDRINILPFLRIVQMSRQVDYRTYIMYSHGQKFIEEFEEKIKSGKKIVLVSNCKAILQTVFDEIHVPSGNKMIITGDSDRDTKLTSSNPDLYWNKDLFAFNSAVGPGTSFNPSLYDEMGVIITPNSSSPQVLFQMINRIRTLNDKLVRMIILDGNNQNIPTRAELKERKMLNIVNMQNRQNLFPKTGFFQKMDKEYCRLTIRDIDHKIAKELVANQMMTLRHEDDLFIDMLVDFEYKKRLLENSDEYARQLFELIRRNGGIVREEINPIKKVIETSTRILKTASREHELVRTLDIKKNVIWTVPENYINDFTRPGLKEINKKVPRNDLDAHFMWLAFRKALLMQPEQTLYEKEFFDIIAKKKAINNTLLFSNGLLEKIKNLFEICEINVRPDTGIVHGKVRTSMDFFDNHIDEINKLCGEILELVRAKTQVSYKLAVSGKDSVTKANRAALLNIRKVLECFGIYSEYFTTPERPVTGRSGRPGVATKERYVKAYLEIDEKMQEFRMTIANMDPKTGTPDFGAYERCFKELLTNKI